ncbi:MAG: DUF5103 domain-containing protein [Bacteroidetes bacterium]|nr:MAG: DUF5103 domain-containing protein [Bacteroidota bacterium]
MPSSLRILLGLLSLWLTACPVVTEDSARSRPAYQRGPTLRYEDYVYVANIHSVQFHQLEVAESYPVLYLGRNEPLELEFDELLPEDLRESEFYVDLINCDANWNPSSLLPIEFYEGFTQDRIDLFQRSEFTKMTYVHYTYRFPQENEFFKMSGNYLLKVYRGNNPDDLVLTRRFVVVDRRIPISSKYLLGERIERERLTEFSFELTAPGLQIFNPAQDLDVRVLQNFRWDNAVRIPQPRFYGDNRYEYYIDFLKSFDSGNEFRRHLIESTRLYSESVQDIEERPQFFDVFLYPDQPRARNVFQTRRDRNGSFGIRVLEWQRPHIQADYVRNHFALEVDAPLPPDDKVFVFGRFSDWQLMPAYQMRYDSLRRRYEASFFLKQGIYDYQYVVRHGDDPWPDPRPLEGPHTESENFYSILVYHRQPGDRSDRLLGYQPLNYYE